MILIWECLDDALHQVLLSKSVLACDDDLENAWEDDLLVDVVSDALKVAQPDDVFADGHTQLVTLNFALLLIFVR